MQNKVRDSSEGEQRRLDSAEAGRSVALSVTWFTQSFRFWKWTLNSNSTFLCVEFSPWYSVYTCFYSLTTNVGCSHQGMTSFQAQADLFRKKKKIECLKTLSQSLQSSRSDTATVLKRMLFYKCRGCNLCGLDSKRVSVWKGKLWALEQTKRWKQWASPSFIGKWIFFFYLSQTCTIILCWGHQTLFSQAKLWRNAQGLCVSIIYNVRET